MYSSYRDYTLNKFALKLVTESALYLQYPSLLSLAEIILVFPSNTAEVERGFSYQNATKTKFRNRLGPEHLDQLLRLRLNASKADNFPFNLAYKHWIEAKHSRNVVSKPCEK